MATDNRYNGWTNYETWNYALWLGNDQGSQEWCVEMAQECFDSAEADKTFTRADRATLNMADQLKYGCGESLEQWMPQQSGPFADILNAGISAINWYEIARNYVDEIEQEAAA